MKKIKYIVCCILATFMMIGAVSAASGSITASTSTRTAAVGSTFTVTVKVSCSEAIGSWQFGISYDSANISLVSGDTNVAGYGDGSIKSKTYTYKFKAIKSGSAGIRISSPSMVSWNDDATLFTPSSSGTTVTVKTQAEIQASYSKDNNLKSLSVEGYELSPAFSKDVTSYSVEVPDTVEEISVVAKVNDSTATVTGTGKIDIAEGTNKIDVVVTAQNGSTKTYSILVNVKDLNPIEVEIDNKKWTVVKKINLLTQPTGSTPSTITIDDIEVPAFKSEITGLTVLGLKDEEGTIAMYSYDEDTKEYKLYEEIKGSSLILYPISMVDIPEGFEETILTINEREYTGLKSTSKELYLIYAMNVETGYQGYYVYDANENSYIRYNEEIFGSSKKVKELKMFLVALSGVSIILLIISIVAGINNQRTIKAVRKLRFKDESKQDEKMKEEPKKVEEQPKEENTNTKDSQSKSTENKSKKKAQKK